MTTRSSTPEPATEAEDPRGTLLRLALAAWAVTVVARWCLERVPPEFDEPLWLRWARACVEHPVRTPLALGLLGWGLTRRTPGPDPPGLGPGFGPGKGL